MPDIKEMKPTILSNIKQASESAKTIDEENLDVSKEQVNVLDSIHLAIKDQQRQTKKDFSRTKERERVKVFSRMTELLSGIKDKIKIDSKEFSIWKIVLVGVLSTLFGIVKKFALVGKGLMFSVKLLKKTIGNLGLKLLRLFKLDFLKKTKFGLFISNFKNRFQKFFKVIGIFGSRLKKVFGFVTKIFKPIMKFLGPLLRVGGTLGKAIPIIGWVFAAVTTIIDGIRGFFKAAEFFDKEKENVTIGERIASVIGSILSGFTFGLLGDAKKFSNIVYKVGDFLMHPIRGIVDSTKMLLTNISEFGQWVGDWFVSSMNKTKNIFLDKLSALVGLGSIIWDWFKERWTETRNQFISDIKNLVGIGKIIGAFGKKVVNKIFENIKNIFSMNNDDNSFFGRIKSVFKNFATSLGKLVSVFWNWIQERATNIGGVIGRLVKKVFQKGKERQAKIQAERTITNIEEINKTKRIVDPLVSADVSDKKLAKTIVKIKEQEDKKPKFVTLSESMSDIQRMQTLMRFMTGEFSNVMAKKIGAVMGKGDTKKPEDVQVAPVIVK